MLRTCLCGLLWGAGAGVAIAPYIESERAEASREAALAQATHHASIRVKTSRVELVGEQVVGAQPELEREPKRETLRERAAGAPELERESERKRRPEPERRAQAASRSPQPLCPTAGADYCCGDGRDDRHDGA